MFEDSTCQILEKSSGPSGNVYFISFYFWSIFLLHTFARPFWGLASKTAPELRAPTDFGTEICMGQILDTLSASHSELPFSSDQTRKLTIAKKFLRRWNQRENLHPPGLFAGKVKFIVFK